MDGLRKLLSDVQLTVDADCEDTCEAIPDRPKNRLRISHKLIKYVDMDVYGN